MTAKLISIDRGANKKDGKKFEHDLKNYLEQRTAEFSPNASDSDNNGGNPVNRFFADERKLLRKLIDLVRADVNRFKIGSSKTPKNWQEEWPGGPREVLPFVHGLFARHQALASLTLGLPEHVDLASLARPWAFLAALKQHTARESGHPLEELHLRAHWSEASETGDWKVYVNLDGMLVSGNYSISLIDLHFSLMCC